MYISIIDRVLTLIDLARPRWLICVLVTGWIHGTQFDWKLLERVERAKSSYGAHRLQRFSDNTRCTDLMLSDDIPNREWPAPG